VNCFTCVAVGGCVYETKQSAALLLLQLLDLIIPVSGQAEVGFNGVSRYA